MSISSEVTSWYTKIGVSIEKSRKIRGGNFVQLATVDEISKEPRCRTVVFRGFLDHSHVGKEENEKVQSVDTSHCFKMITDIRSNKVQEAGYDGSSVAEMVWWFSKSSEQYRIRGILRFVGEEDKAKCQLDDFLKQKRKEQWGSLSDMAREQFYWKDPSLPYEEQNIVPAGGRGDDGKILPAPKNFLLMLLYPTRVDYLRLTGNYRQIDEFHSGHWICKRVNP